MSDSNDKAYSPKDTKRLVAVTGCCGFSREPYMPRLAALRVYGACCYAPGQAVANFPMT